MQELLQKMPEYSFEEESCKCVFKLHEPGIYLIQAKGELTQASAAFLCETLPLLQAWLMNQQKLVYFVVDIQCDKATAHARNYLLRQLRWKLSGRVVRCYIYFKVPLARALMELLAKINHRTSFESVSSWSDGVEKARQHQQHFQNKSLSTPPDPMISLPEALKNTELKVYFYQTKNNAGYVHFFKPNPHCLYLYFSGQISREIIQHTAPICRGLFQDMPLDEQKHELIIDARYTSQIDKSAIFEVYRQHLTQKPSKSIYFIRPEFSESQRKKQQRWVYFMITSLFKNLFFISDYETVTHHLLKKTPLHAGTKPEPESPEEELKHLRQWCQQQEKLLLAEREQHTQEMEQIRNILWMLLLRESRSPLQVNIPRGDSLSSDTLQLLDVFQRDQFQLIKDLQHQIDERTRAEQRAAHANEIKGEFLASMSHDIRTPLNAILGFANVLKAQKKDPLSAEQSLYLSRIQENGAHLLGLVNNILDLSELESGKLKIKREKVALDLLITNIVSQLGVLIDNKGLEVSLKLCKGFLDTDEQRLQQIIVNLLNNAIKFTEYGSIIVRCECREDRLFALHVEDTGCGISQEAQQRIFEAFEQESTSVKKEGSGLGLAICTRLCNHLGYHLGLQSEREQGSVFSLYFQSRA
jgi:signal transduction histidine kinase